MKPMTDAARVLGQISRGEVQAGPEGARRIAARHEAAYGVVWRTTPAEPAASAASAAADAAWAAAITALTDETPGGVAA